MGASCSSRVNAADFPVSRLPAAQAALCFSQASKWPRMRRATASTSWHSRFSYGAFEAIKASLAATGVALSKVVRLDTFHNCRNKPNFNGNFRAQVDAMIEVKAQSMKPPYSTWNAFCVDRHYSERTVVEIVVEAYAPVKSHSSEHLPIHLIRADDRAVR